MPSIWSRLDCVINAGMDKNANDTIDFRSWKSPMSSRTSACIVCIYKEQIERWPGESKIRGVMTQALIENRHATFEDGANEY